MGSGVVSGRHLQVIVTRTLLIIVACATPAHAQVSSGHACVDLLRMDRGPIGLGDAAQQTLAAAAARMPTAAEVRQTAAQVLRATENSGRETAAALCDTLSVEAGPEPALLTGYYRPVVPARRERDAEFRYPLYGLPPPDVRGLSRAAIEAGALDGKAPVVAWLEDPVEAFFIHIQGSAVLAMPDGETAVGFAGSNDRPYTSIGSVLVASGRMRREDVSMDALKEYLRDHPAERDALLQRNERYIYFQTISRDAIGSLGVPLTDGRSVAADPAVYPPGTLLFIRPRDTHPDVTPRLVFVQDRGSAIVGAARLDLYVGTGDEAARIAGPLQLPVDVFVIRPR